MLPRGVLVWNQSPVRISLHKLLGLEPTTRSTTSLCESVSTSESDEVTGCLTFLSGGCCRCATNRVRGVAGILFRMASRQTATIATSCSIWPHEILAFTTSTFPSFYSSYILAHFQVLTIQSHATQLTTLCAEERSYMSNTSSLLFSLPVIFVLDR